MRILTKIKWYFFNILKLLVVSIRLLVYCLLRPQKLFELFFLIFSDLNDFYQVSHGRLLHFEDTKVFKELKEQMTFIQCNYFFEDEKVTRSGETQVLSSLVNYFKPKTIFEIGTYNGFTTLHFACNSPDDAVIYTLDLPPDFGDDKKGQETLAKYSYDDLLVVQLSKENVEERIFHDHPLGDKIKEIFGNSRTFDFSPFYGKMDLIFIDGNHSYEYVKSDTENAFKMLSPNGVIIWHDYDYIIHRDVFKYLNALSEKHKIYSIPHTRFAIYSANL